MTAAFPYHRDCYTWPRLALFNENEGAELRVHCLCDPVRRQFSLVGFIGTGREEQIDQVIALAESVGAEVKVITGVGLTDEIVQRLVANMQTFDDCPDEEFCCVAVDWPNKIQRRVLRELARTTSPNGAFVPEEKVARRLHIPVEEVRQHLRVLGDIGLAQEADDSMLERRFPQWPTIPARD